MTVTSRTSLWTDDISEAGEYRHMSSSLLDGKTAEGEDREELIPRQPWP